MIWIIITTEKLGGAEKRFAGIWEGLVNQAGYSDSIRLVLPRELYNIFSSSIEFKDSFQKYQSSIFIYDFSYAAGASALRKKLYDFVNTFTKAGDSIHFIDTHPLRSFKNRQVVFSVTQSSLKNLSLKGKTAQLLAIWLSQKTDVLDPGIYKFVRRLFFMKRKTISQTPGSFCNTALFKPVNWADKKNQVVFMGRLEPVKQIVNFVKAIPAVYEATGGKEKAFEFYIIGWGTLKAEIEIMLQAEAYKDIPVVFKYMDNVHEVMNTAKYFVSLQLYNNYPSKSLIEAMSAGALPIVTDTGQTRWIVKDEFGFFVKESFTTGDLTEIFSAITQMPDSLLEKKSRLAREFILDNYSVNRSVDYFIKIYNDHH
jgi:glycosyltransferase involved in cell wall biosynthesis